MTDQRTDEWYAQRLGRVTASRIADATARTKSGWGASRENYMSELIVERLTGQPYESYTNAAMQRGLELEPEARVAYEFYADCVVEQTGFVPHPSIVMSGASPDGLIGGDGLCEIKCPNTGTHIETLLSSLIDRKYLVQMQWQMACTGRAWCDFVSYDPRMPEQMRLFVKRVLRDDILIAGLTKDVSEFLAELDGKIAALRARYNQSTILDAG